MSLAVKLHECIDAYNILKKPTEITSDFLSNHPTLYKIVMIANHIFRATMMTFFMLALTFSFLVSCAICFTASLIYRLSVENNCAYKFALPAFGGAMVFPLGIAALTDMVSGVAFATLGAFAAAAAALLPLIAYIVYITLTVSYDVDDRLGLIAGTEN
jgi:hypothetical protein